MGTRWMRRLLGSLALVFLPAAAVQAGELYVVTKANDWTPHVGCVIRYDDGRVKWLHFRPIEFKKSIFCMKIPGQVDFIGYERDINHLVGFRIADAKLRAAENAACSEFARDPRYQLFKRDCVTFSMLVCETAGLKTKDEHLAPITFFRYVKENNDFFEAAWEVDRDKDDSYTVPWRRE